MEICSKQKSINMLLNGYCGEVFTLRNTSRFAASEFIIFLLRFAMNSHLLIALRQNNKHKFSGNLFNSSKFKLSSSRWKNIQNVFVEYLKGLKKVKVRRFIIFFSCSPFTVPGMTLRARAIASLFFVIFLRSVKIWLLLLVSTQTHNLNNNLTWRFPTRASNSKFSVEWLEAGSTMNRFGIVSRCVSFFDDVFTLFFRVNHVRLSSNDSRKRLRALEVLKWVRNFDENYLQFFLVFEFNTLQWKSHH